MLIAKFALRRTLDGGGEVDLGSAAGRRDRVLGVPPLPLLLLLDQSARLGVAPHVCAAVRGGDVEQRNTLERGTVGQVQGDAITLYGMEPRKMGI